MAAGRGERDALSAPCPGAGQLLGAGFALGVEGAHGMPCCPVVTSWMARLTAHPALGGALFSPQSFGASIFSFL